MIYPRVGLFNLVASLEAPNIRDPQFRSGLAIPQKRLIKTDGECTSM